MLRKTVDRILSKNRQSDGTLGEDLAEVLFDNEYEALLTDLESGKVVVFAPENRATLLRKGVSLLADLDYLEENHLIFRIPESYIEGKILFCRNGIEFPEEGQYKGELKTTGKSWINTENGEYFLKTSEDTNIKGEIIPDEELTEQIAGTLCSRVWSTDLLERFRKQGCQTDSVWLTRKANCYSRWALGAAVVIALTSPFLNTQCSKTTIEEKQFKELTDTIRATSADRRVINCNVIENVQKPE